MLKYFLGLLTALSLYSASTHIVILGDLHLPGKHPQMKEEVLEHIKSNGKMLRWSLSIGCDLCSQTGTMEEYAYVKAYFSKN